jgi:uncharacterized membrane protein YphA (DoxX/SURF4 family)
MNLALTVVSIVVAVAFLASGIPKIIRHPEMVNRAEHIGFTANTYVLIGLLEVAGAGGLVLGLVWLPLLGIAAGIGLMLLMFLGALAHIRNGDKPPVYAPALVLGLLSATTVVLAFAS